MQPISAETAADTKRTFEISVMGLPGFLEWAQIKFMRPG